MSRVTDFGNRKSEIGKLIEDGFLGNQNRNENFRTLENWQVARDLVHAIQFPESTTLLTLLTLLLD